MQRRIKVILTAIPSLLLVFVIYAIYNLDDLLEGITFVAGWLGSAQGQFSTIILLLGTIFNLYGKFRQANLPKKLGQLFGWEKALRNLKFLNTFLDRFTLDEIMTLVRNVDVLAEEMKTEIHRAVKTLGFEITEQLEPKIKRPRRTRNEVAIAVAEQLRLLGKHVEIKLIQEKAIPGPGEIRDKILGKFGKQLDDAKTREQDRLRELQSELKHSQTRLATILQSTEKEI